MLWSHDLGRLAARACWVSADSRQRVPAFAFFPWVKGSARPTLPHGVLSSLFHTGGERRLFVDPRLPVTHGFPSFFRLCCGLVANWCDCSLWTAACQAPLSMEFSSWEYWSELPFPSPEDLPDLIQGSNPGLLHFRWPSALQAGSLLNEPQGLFIYWFGCVRPLVAACGIWFPDQGSNLGPLHWECRVLATGPPGKPQQLSHFCTHICLWPSRVPRPPAQQRPGSVILGERLSQQLPWRGTCMPGCKWAPCVHHPLTFVWRLEQKSALLFSSNSTEGLFVTEAESLPWGLELLWATSVPWPGGELWEFVLRTKWKGTHWGGVNSSCRSWKSTPKSLHGMPSNFTMFRNLPYSK